MFLFEFFRFFLFFGFGSYIFGGDVVVFYFIEGFE